MREEAKEDLCIEWSRELNLKVCCAIFRSNPVTRQLDMLATFETSAKGTSTAPTMRYAVRQVLDQEFQKYVIVQRAAASQARFAAGSIPGQEPDDRCSQTFKDKGIGVAAIGTSTKALDRASGVKRDFFGRIVAGESTGKGRGREQQLKISRTKAAQNRIWVSYREGYSNAVRKPVNLSNLIDGL